MGLIKTVALFLLAIALTMGIASLLAATLPTSIASFISFLVGMILGSVVVLIAIERDWLF